MVIHVATVESQTNPYEVLSDKQKDELKSVYKKIIEDVNKKENSKCTDKKSC